MTKKNKILKYNLTNLDTEEELLTMSTKKDTIAWLQEQIKPLSDEEQIKLAAEFYGKELPKLGFHISSIKHINYIATTQRFKKIIKKPFVLAGTKYKIDAIEKGAKK